MRRVFVSLGLVGVVSALSAASCGEALTPGDCPGTPTELSLKAVAPYWGGLVTLEYQVPDGTAGGIDLQIYNPDLDLWQGGYYGNYDQRPDGTYVAIVTVNVGEHDKDLEHKLRVRTTLDGCAPSDWAESKGFTLTDPLPGTTWKADLDPNGQISIFPNGAGTITYVGPYTLDGSKEISHTIVFGTDGSAQEEMKFTIQSGTPGDGYDGCSFDIHFDSHYETTFQSSTSVKLTDRKLAANASAGSSCNTPALSSMRLSMPTAEFELGASNGYYYAFDYSALLSKTPGKAKWNALSFADGFSQSIQTLTVVTGIETTSVSPNVYFYDVSYVKQ